VKVGVPQGSILGPLLFILYLNDLPQAVKDGDVSMYADDTEMDYTGTSTSELEDKMNTDLKNVSTYFAANKLSLNVKKCEVLLCGTRQRVANKDLNIKVNNNPISCVTNSTFLGFDIDENLTWSSHINKLVSKLSYKIGLLRKLREIVPQETCHLLYNSLVLPHFDYADTVYDSANATDLDRLQKLQTRAARILTGSNYRRPRKEMFQSLGWMSLKNRRMLNKSTMMYKCLNGLAPSYLSELFKTPNHCYTTRNSHKLSVPSAKTAYYRKSFEISGAIL
jgi:hypothetical protein